MMSEETTTQASLEECTNKLKALVLQTQHIFASAKKENDLLNRIFLRLKQTGYDEKFFKIAQLHAKTMEDVLVANKNFKNLKFQSPEQCLSYYTAKVFFDKMMLYEGLSFPVNIDDDNPIKILPIQAFLKQNKEARLKFEQTIQENDVLYVEVINNVSALPIDKNSEHVELRIISRVNLNVNTDCEFVYHLNSHAFMFKNLELTRLGRTGFSTSEVLKVVVLGKTKVSARIFVTTNNAALKIPGCQHSSATLGIVSPSELPFDLNSFKIGSNFQGYANYLRSFATFYQSHNFKIEIASIGVDPYRVYSFYPTRDGMTIPPNESAAKLYEHAKEATHAESLIHLVEAKTFMERIEYQKAISAFEDCLKCWPENYQVYETRGKMYLEMCKKKQRRGSFLKKAMEDFETALKLNPSAHEPKKCLSNILVYLSKRLVKNKDYDNAEKLVKRASNLSPENVIASTMQKKIQKKKNTPDFIVIEDDMDLTMLEMRKKLIENQLKKEVSV